MHTGRLAVRSRQGTVYRAQLSSMRTPGPATPCGCRRDGARGRSRGSAAGRALVDGRDAGRGEAPLHVPAQPALAPVEAAAVARAALHARVLQVQGHTAGARLRAPRGAVSPGPQAGAGGKGGPAPSRRPPLRQAGPPLAATLEWQGRLSRCAIPSCGTTSPHADRTGCSKPAVRPHTQLGRGAGGGPRGFDQAPARPGAPRARARAPGARAPAGAAAARRGRARARRAARLRRPPRPPPGSGSPTAARARQTHSAAGSRCAGACRSSLRGAAAAGTGLAAGVRSTRGRGHRRRAASGLVTLRVRQDGCRHCAGNCAHWASRRLAGSHSCQKRALACVPACVAKASSAHCSSRCGGLPQCSCRGRCQSAAGGQPRLPAAAPEAAL